MALAGPRVVEHLVDVVLMFEGDRRQELRVLRGVKNRFGATSELGLFAMEGEGLVGVPDPSRALLAERPEEAAGSVVVAAVEGSRPLLVEVQALLVRAYGTPRRVVSGLEPERAALVLAVLERHLGFRIGEMDAYFKITGGINVSDPALDLGIALAAASSLSGRPIPTDWVVTGELGLTGEVRRVGRLRDRLREAESLGFRRALMPDPAPSGVELAAVPVRRLDEAVARVGLGPEGPRTRREEGGKGRSR